jgi:lipoyl(octanoyl) transferase
VIAVVQLGTLDYATATRLQESLVEARKRGRILEVLLLLEHSPVITLGRNAHAANVRASAEELHRRGVEKFECDRGGDVTFHGPGQLVGYPILDLHAFPSDDGKRKTLGVIEYVRRLEEVLIRTCSDFGIMCERVPGLTGVWTRGSEHSAQAKIAALGVHISRGVTTHGFALNVNTDLSFFNLIVPCGITAKPVTSMAKELGREVSMDEVRRCLVENFGQVFHQPAEQVASLEALTAPADLPMKIPKNLRELNREDEISWA